LEVPEPDLVGPEWVTQPGTGTQIAVSPQGFAWVINGKGNIFFWDGASFLQYPTGCASSIAVGPPSLADPGWVFGEPWITGCSESNSGAFQGFSVYQLRYGSWVLIPGPAADQISVSPDLGVPWLVNYSGQIFE
jgi:hypothetical protein